MARSIDIALSQTKAGRNLKWQARRKIAREKEREEIRARIRALKELAHDTFVRKTRRWDVYDAARQNIRNLGARGGPEYEKALSAVKFAMVSRDDFRDAIHAVAPGHPVRLK